MLQVNFDVSMSVEKIVGWVLLLTTMAATTTFSSEVFCSLLAEAVAKILSQLLEKNIK